ncbi:MAG: beta-propeller fold lactonase family protein [Gemmatimonadales bacterium]
MRHKIWWAAAALGVAACGRDSTAPSVVNDGVRSAFDRQEGEADDQEGRAGVFTLSNNAQNNMVIAFARESDGQLRAAGTFATGGRGTGGGLGSQGAVVMSEDGKRLYAVNAGSNDITSFRVTDHGLVRVATVWSGGTRPISVAVGHGLLYVLNGGSAGNITGFRAGMDGGLDAIPNSTRPLSSGASGPAQVGITPSGRVLVVTEKATNKITTYLVNGDGTPGAPVVNTSAGQTPFGFTFDQRGLLIVSEAFGGAPNASAASSYSINADGTLDVISASVPTTETAACWFVVTKNGRFAYTTNTGSASVSGYAVENGALRLLDDDGKTGNTDPTPIDAALSVNSRYLYVLSGTSISAFRVNNHSGALTSVVSGVSGLPTGTVGLAAR